MSDLLLDLKAFLERSPTSWHAVQQMGNRLASCDFSPLDEQEPWVLEPGKKYFVCRGGSFCAFILPYHKPIRSCLLASHTDSPGLKLKPQPGIFKQNMGLLGVETYGSPLLTSWLNRDLGLAGRVVVLNAQGTLEEKLVFLDDIGLIIPQLAIHLDREIHEKGVHLNKQDHLRPLIGLFEPTPDPMQMIEWLIRRHLSFQRLISFELFLVPLEGARFIGYQNEMIAAYRIDNLVSAHAGISAMAYLREPTENLLQMALCFDHEEIGSATGTGAISPFFSDLFQRLAIALKLSSEEQLLLKNRSLCISIDMAHALHPNHPDKHDPQHQPLLGKGPVLKYNAQYKYATDALSAAPVIQACQALNLPYQSFVSRSDMPCGSTLGPLMAERLGIPTVDIGIPQLSMHSIREVIACQDYLDLCRLLTHLTEQGG